MSDSPIQLEGPLRYLSHLVLLVSLVVLAIGIALLVAGIYKETERHNLNYAGACLAVYASYMCFSALRGIFKNLNNYALT